MYLGKKKQQKVPKNRFQNANGYLECKREFRNLIKYSLIYTTSLKVLFWKKY